MFTTSVIIIILLSTGVLFKSSLVLVHSFTSPRPPLLLVRQQQQRQNDILPYYSSSSSCCAATTSKAITTTTRSQDDENTTGSTTTPPPTTTYYDPSDAFNNVDEDSSPLTRTYLDLLRIQQDSSSSLDSTTTTTVTSTTTKSNTDIIMKDLDGNPLTIDYFIDKLPCCNNKRQKIISFTCPKEDTFQDLNGNGGRIYIHYNNNNNNAVVDDNDENNNSPPSSVFYKNIDFEQNPHAHEKMNIAPHKVLRDIHSYVVVSNFLNSKAVQMLQEQTNNTIIIPKCYYNELRPDHENPIKSKFSFLLEDLSPNNGWYQRWLINDIHECYTTLSTYAKIHAFFWYNSNFWKNNKDDITEEFYDGVWESGSYVQPKFQNVNQCDIVAKEWDIKKVKFEKYLSDKPYYNNLGHRLQSVVKEFGKYSHPFATEYYDDDTISEQYKKYRTFTHGDPKQANIFFRRMNNNNNEIQQQQLQIGLIDFQWSGFGLAATDIAHFISSAIYADLLVNDDGEEKVLEYYYNELQKYLIEFGVYKNKEDAIEQYSYKTFIEQYEIAIIDICRIMIAYTWTRFTEEVNINDINACTRTMNKTSYNKSIINIIWLLNKCDTILKSRGI